MPSRDFSELFDETVDEGQRRLGQSTLEMAVTSFIAGFTIVFGIVALGIVHAAVEPQFGRVARVAGALAFGVGLAFLIVGRTELFTENFYDPAAAVVEAGFDADALRSLLRLWAVTLVCNLLGGLLFVLVLSVEGSLPTGTGEALVSTSEEVAHRPIAGRFASGFAGGALVTLLSFLLVAAGSETEKLFLAYVTGVLLALGPFDHVVVTVLHVGFGMRYGAAVAPGALLEIAAVVTVANLVGGIGLVTTTHVGQAMAARSDGE